MRASVTICRLHGIPMEIHASWAPVFFFVTWTLAERFFPLVYPPSSGIVDWALGVLSGLLLFASLVAHELGHAIAARWRGLTVYRISLFLFGGMVDIGVDEGNASDEFWLAAAGPAVSLLIALLWAALWVVAPGLDSQGRAMVLYLGVSNAILATFNLLPSYPLDGGRILRSALWSIGGDVSRATRFAQLSGQAMGGVILIAGVVWLVRGNVVDGGWLAALGLFLVLAARHAIPRSLLLPS